MIPLAETAPPDIVLKKKAQRVNPNPGAHIYRQKIPFCLLEVSEGDDCSVYGWRVSIQHLYGLCLCFHSDTFHITWLPYSLLYQMSFWGVDFDLQDRLWFAELDGGILLHYSPGFLDYVPLWNATEIKKFIFQPQICIIRQLELEGATVALFPSDR